MRNLETSSRMRCCYSLFQMTMRLDLWPRDVNNLHYLFRQNGLFCFYRFCSFSGFDEVLFLLWNGKLIFSTFSGGKGAWTFQIDYNKGGSRNMSDKNMWFSRTKSELRSQWKKSLCSRCFGLHTRLKRFPTLSRVTPENLPTKHPARAPTDCDRIAMFLHLAYKHRFCRAPCLQSTRHSLFIVTHTYTHQLNTNHTHPLTMYK